MPILPKHFFPNSTNKQKIISELWSLISEHFLKCQVDGKLWFIFLRLSKIRLHIRYCRYPIYARGNPQLRIFLPNFWMKIVKNKHAKLPPNHVQFQVSPEMTRLDVKNYLEKIYNVPVYHVYTRNVSGEVKKPGFLDPVSKTTPLYKEDDIKYAYVTLVSIENYHFITLKITVYSFFSLRMWHLSFQTF